MKRFKISHKDMFTEGCLYALLPAVLFVIPSPFLGSRILPPPHLSLTESLSLTHVHDMRGERPGNEFRKSRSYNELDLLYYHTFSPTAFAPSAIASSLISQLTGICWPVRVTLTIPHGELPSTRTSSRSW